MYLGKIVERSPAPVLYERPIHPYSVALLSAVPIPDPKVNAERKPIVLEGDVPSPVDPPSACRFHTRCPWASDICSQDEPPLADYGSGQAAACHHPQNVDPRADEGHRGRSGQPGVGQRQTARRGGAGDGGYSIASCGCSPSITAPPAAAVRFRTRPGPWRGRSTPSSRPTPRAIANLATSEGAERVIVGLPTTLGGEEGDQARVSRAFAAELAELLDVPVETYDERLTTRMADRSAREGARADRDSLAAAHLLESYLAREGSS